MDNHNALFPFDARLLEAQPVGADALTLCNSGVCEDAHFPTFFVPGRYHLGGLNILQIPCQFAAWLSWVAPTVMPSGPVSYMEIGCASGGTLALAQRYFSERNGLTRLVGVDLGFGQAFLSWASKRPGCFDLRVCDTKSAAFDALLVEFPPFDAIFIDGDHTYEGVRNDFLKVHGHANVIGFHDLHRLASEDSGPGTFYYCDLKRIYEDTYNFHEILFRDGLRDGVAPLGIGVATRKVWL